MPSGPLLAWMNPLPLELTPALRERRRSLAARASGRVLDLGGWSDHVASYAAAAVDVLGPEPRGASPDPPRVRRLTVSLEALPDLGGEAYDTIVSLIRTPLVADLTRFLATLRGLLRDDGCLLFLEPVARGDALGRVLAVAGRVLGATAGLHLDRDVVATVREAGFFVSDLNRFRVPSVSAPLRPFVEGRAWLRSPLSSPS